MRKAVVAAAMSLPLILGAGAVAIAQNDPPPPPAAAGAAVPPGPDGGPAAMWGRHHGAMDGNWRHHRRFEPRTFALFHPPADRQLSTADVQQVAQGILAWNGQHQWKVTDVEQAGPGRIGFTYAAPDGTAIARFTVDSATGKIHRVQ